jgi:DUF4097 and DUF4098 domain-containing protein YvlB
VTVHERLTTSAVLLAAAFVLPGCMSGPGVSGSFDRNYTVMGHIRLEVTELSGQVNITGSADGQVHIHGDVHARSMGFEKPRERLDQTLADLGIEQKGDTIRVGKRLSSMRNVSIDYKIEVPHDTEINVTAISGSQNIHDVRGPVTLQGASGAVRVDGVERDTRINSASGSIEVTDIGDDVRASSASGEVTINNAKGDIRANSLSGSVHVTKPGGRVDADSASGSIDIKGAKFDVKAHDVSGEVNIHGDPGDHGYWDLKTVSGAVQVYVPSNSNFRFSAEAISGEIRTDIPIVIEEQGKHSLRAHIGNGGGRVEVHTVSGEIHVSGGS